MKIDGLTARQKETVTQNDRVKDGGRSMENREHGESIIAKRQKNWSCETETPQKMK